MPSLRSHQFSRHLLPPLNLRSSRPEPELSGDEHEPEVVSEPVTLEPRPPLSATERRGKAHRSLARCLSSKFYQAGAVYQALSSMLEQVAWRLRNATSGPRLWTWSLSGGRPGGPFFADPLEAAMCAFQTYDHQWSVHMALGEPRVSESDAAILAAAREKLLQHRHFSL
jgi:hypothetical protein